jgi:hypothetical protein
MEPPLSLLTYSWCYQVSTEDLRVPFKAVTAPDIAESDHREVELGKLEAEKAEHEAEKAKYGLLKKPVALATDLLFLVVRQ